MGCSENTKEDGCKEWVHSVLELYLYHTQIGKTLEVISYCALFHQDLLLTMMTEHL